MHKIAILPYKRALLIMLVLLIFLSSVPDQAQAQWPPFRFQLTPTHSDGKITYKIFFRSLVDWNMSNLAINIPLPEGTRFVEAGAEETTSATFDGQEIQFFTATFHRPLRNAYFTVEITDSSKVEFAAQAWIGWEGDNPGDYLTNKVSVDVTRKPLNWNSLPSSRLRLRTEAIVKDDIITYNLYPRNVRGSRWLRMWDVKINVPVPEGTTFLSAESSPPFVASFDGREVSFSAIELAYRGEVVPLRFNVSIEEVADPFVVTHAWATWKNSSRQAVRRIEGKENLVTGDIIAQPHVSQKIASDINDDVPFSSYDLTSISFQNTGDTFEVTYHTVGALCSADAPIELYLYIDGDCNLETGLRAAGLGAEYQLLYRLAENNARVRSWDSERNKWGAFTSVKEISLAGQKTALVSIPHELIGNDQEFCWVGRSRYVTSEFSPNPPNDWVFTSSTIDLSALEIMPSTTMDNPIDDSEDNSENLSHATSSDICESEQSLPASPSQLTDINGKIAVPLDNGQDRYDVHIFSLPEGQEIAKISNARQPNFRLDGQRMLINREGGGIENLYEYNFVDGSERQVSDAPRDTHPFYDPWGNRVVYGNEELAVGSKKRRPREDSQIVLDAVEKGIYDNPQRPFIFVQCGLLPPHQETDPRCKNISSLGVLVPAGQIGEIQGTHPVWTLNDMIAFNGCNTWAGSRLCGIYAVSSASTKGFSDGFIPTPLTRESRDLPADTKGDLITFTSYRDGNWEAYVMNLNGAGVRNLSNRPDANDGLPTISPDGNWVAFVSDRDGRWAIWGVPVNGGQPPHKLFDLPTNAPWGDRDRLWTNERISWGP